MAAGWMEVKVMKEVVSMSRVLAGER